MDQAPGPDLASSRFTVEQIPSNNINRKSVGNQRNFFIAAC
jgi:hypothetical protein